MTISFDGADLAMMVLIFDGAGLMGGGGGNCDEKHLMT